MEVQNRLYIAQALESNSLDESFICFRPRHALRYEPCCDDFGPLNMSCVANFIKSLDKCINSFPDCKIAFCIENGPRNLTNAVFLVGAYLILKEHKPSKQVAAQFASLKVGMLVPYRDATYAGPDFNLDLIDCWRSLERGVKKGWLRVSETADLSGRISMNSYRHYSNPANGNLHEVIPGKFIAFKGPVDLGGRKFHEDANGVQHFSPSYYAEVFREMGVSTIIRLNELRYDAKAFTSQGFEHFDLEFEKCTYPPDIIVAAFFRIVDAATGAIAVNCGDGLGATGTLIALHLMRSHRFSAREAMAWLRIMRPGSITGEQQDYLCLVDDKLRAQKTNQSMKTQADSGIRLAADIGFDEDEFGPGGESEGSQEDEEKGIRMPAPKSKLQRGSSTSGSLKARLRISLPRARSTSPIRTDGAGRTAERGLRPAVSLPNLLYDRSIYNRTVGKAVLTCASERNGQRGSGDARRRVSEFETLIRGL